MNKKISRVPLALVVTIALTLTACGAGASQSVDKGQKNTESGFSCPEVENPVKVTSTELNIFALADSIPAEMLECFELRYGITVSHDEYATYEEMYVMVAAGGSGYDLVQPPDYLTSLMINDGLLQELTHDKLPALENYNADYLNPDFDPGNRYTIPYLISTQALVVNPAAVQNMPGSWSDLWKLEYAGKIGLVDDARVVIGLTLLTLGYDVNTTDPAQLAHAATKLQELIPNVQLYDSESLAAALATGEVGLGVLGSREAILARRQAPSLRYIYPAEGAFVAQDHWAILKDAPHLDAVYAWLNYTMQGDVSWLVLRDYPYTIANRVALDYARDNQQAIYDAYMNSPILNIPPEIFKNGHRIMDIGESVILFDDIWINAALTE